MLRIHLAVALGCLLLPCTAPAQPGPDSLDNPPTVRDRLDRVLDEQSADADVAARAAEVLTRLSTHPLDVNRASAADLNILPQVSPLLARRIVQHRAEAGRFPSVEALTAVKGLGPATLKDIRPFLTVTDAPTASGNGLPSLNALLDQIEGKVLQRATRELDLGRGYADDTSRTTFQGPPGRLTTRLRVHHPRHGQLAVTLDKDPGEALRWKPQQAQYGFDHVAGNLTLRDLGPLKTLILGDYSAQFGQGVTLWRGLTFGKGGDPVSPLIRSGRGLVPFQSTSEERFFRGVAATLSLPAGLSLSAFLSRRRRDATLRDEAPPDSIDTPRPARTLSSGGLHRTPSERQRRDVFGLETGGGALEYRTGGFRVGMVGYQSRFDRPLRPPDAPYRRFSVSGTQTSMIGLYARALLDRYTLFGEAARATTGHYGGLVGAALDVDDRVQALVLGRHYPRSFPGLYNAAVGESGDTQGETGVYAGVRLRVARRWHVGAYVDQYRFSWVDYTVPRPSRGLDTRLTVEYTPRPWWSTTLEVRAERELAGVERRGPGGRRLAAVAMEERQSAEWETEYTFSDAFTLRTRIQGARVQAAQGPVTYGLLVAQDLEVRPVESLTLDARVALFDTDDYASRLYAYERDLLYSFSVPALYGEGRRSYVMAQYDAASSLTIEAKYGVTWYPRRKNIGSGLQSTPGRASREVRLQVRWTL